MYYFRAIYKVKDSYISKLTQYELDTWDLLRHSYQLEPVINSTCFSYRQRLLTAEADNVMMNLPSDINEHMDQFTHICSFYRKFKREARPAAAPYVNLLYGYLNRHVLTHTLVERAILELQLHNNLVPSYKLGRFYDTLPYTLKIPKEWEIEYDSAYYIGQFLILAAVLTTNFEYLVQDNLAKRMAIPNAEQLSFFYDDAMVKLRDYEWTQILDNYQYILDRNQWIYDLKASLPERSARHSTLVIAERYKYQSWNRRQGHSLQLLPKKKKSSLSVRKLVSLY